MPRRRPSAAKSTLPAGPSPEERARAAIAKEEALPGDKVRLTFRIVLARRDAEALSARAIREGPPGGFSRRPGQVVIACPSEGKGDRRSGETPLH